MVFFSVTFGYSGPRISKCHKEALQNADLEDLQSHMYCGEILDQYQALVDEVTTGKATAAGDDDAVSGDTIARETEALPIWSALRKLLFRDSMFIAVCAIVRSSCMFVQVFALSSIIDIVGGEKEGPFGDQLGTQMLAAVLMAVASWLQSLLQHTCFHNCWINGIRARALLVGRIYQKTLTQTPMFIGADTAGTQKNAKPGVGSLGQQMNLMSSDANVVIEAFVMLWVVFSAPFEIIGALIWIGFLVKWSVFGTAAIVVVLLPCQLALGRRVGMLRGRSFAFADRRISALTEYLNGIGVVKFNAWEDPVSSQISDYRKSEGEFLRTGSTLKLLNLTLFFVIPGVLSLVTFGILNIYDTSMSPKTTFVVLALLQMIARMFAMIPRSTTSMASAMTSVNRIEAFLRADFTASLPECPDEGCADASTPQAATVELQQSEFGTADDRSAAIRIRGDFAWDASAAAAARLTNRSPSATSPRNNEPIEEEDDVKEDVHQGGFALRNVDLSVRKGQLLAVAGPVGCGKSTFLHALMRNCAVLSDTCSGAGVALTGKVAYVAQEAWITDGSIRDNILFGLPFEEEKYKKVLRACCLLRDICQWGGDLVEVGEKGVTLSGGQRQRVAMARACYSDADVYLLDDPLSAVDARVGRHLLDNVLMSDEMLRGKAVVLATHNQAAIASADGVVKLNLKGEFTLKAPAALLSVGEAEQPQSSEELHQMASPTSISGDSDHEEKAFALLGEGRKILTAEVAVFGGVTGAVYSAYIKAGGAGKAVLFLFLLIISQALRNASEWWFAVWSERTFDISNTTYVLIELALVCGCGIFAAIRSATYASYTISASTVLHDRMFDSVLRSPMHFFETTPLGRIINRFAKDLDFADDLLPRASFDFLQLIGVAVGSLVLLIATIPWFAIVVAVFSVIFYALLTHYLPAARQLKRIEGMSRSPSHQLFQATLSGLTTVRAYGRQNIYLKRFFATVDGTSRAIITNDSTQRWVGIRMDWMTATWVLAVGLLVIGLQDSLSRGVAGLALGQSLMLTGMLQFAVRMAAETESLMTAVERIHEYGNLPREVDKYGGLSSDETAAAAAASSEGTSPAKTWPSCGKVDVTGLRCAYPSNPETLVLKGVDFDINHGGKLAVVGRTGAGKSTILQCFFRLMDIGDDMISVDGKDIAKLPLRELREGLAVIPQAPTLFNGSVRYNLDPFNQFDDDALIEALHRVQLLKNLIRDNLSEDELDRYTGLIRETGHGEQLLDIKASQLMSSGTATDSLLSSSIGEQGSALSVGQKQLLCAARVLLKQPKLLFMDEATANVDDDTDQSLQFMIRVSCRHTTVITIAHRLQTILDYDRVLVLDGGQVAEFGSPNDLLDDPKSTFSAMVAAFRQEEAAAKSPS